MADTQHSDETGIPGAVLGTFQALCRTQWMPLVLCALQTLVMNKGLAGGRSGSIFGVYRLVSVSNTPGRRRRASSSQTCAIGASDLLAPRLPGFPGIEPAVASSPAPVS